MVTRKKPVNTFYSYSAKHNLRQEEIAAYRRIVLATCIVIALIVGGYFLGVPLLAHLGNNSTDPSTNSQLGSTDSIAPAAPILNSVPDAVRVRSLEISGSAESGTTVIVSVNGEEGLSTLADKQGIFKGEVSLNGGQNEISAIAKDAAGNKSRSSKAILVLYDATPPPLTLLQELPSQTESGNLNISGKTEPKSKVTINDRFVVVNNEGVFNTSVKLNPGENKIVIYAEDAAGNIRKLERTVSFNSKQQATSSAAPQ